MQGIENLNECNNKFGKRAALTAIEIVCDVLQTNRPWRFLPVAENDKDYMRIRCRYNHFKGHAPTELAFNISQPGLLELSYIILSNQHNDMGLISRTFKALLDYCYSKKYVFVIRDCTSDLIRIVEQLDNKGEVIRLLDERDGIYITYIIQGQGLISRVNKRAKSYLENENFSPRIPEEKEDIITPLLKQ